jgi:hypothetical protein
MMKKASKELIREVMQIIQRKLVDHGFKKRSKEILTFDLSSEFLGWLGLNRAVQRGDGSLAINPVIGVRYQRLERAYSELMDENFHAYIPPTLSVNIGYLMPDNSYKTWSFFNKSNNQRIVDDMVAAIEKYGISFMDTMSNEDAILEALKVSDFSMPESRKFRLPLIKYMRGDIEQARAELTRTLEEVNTREDMAAQYYRRFAQKLITKLQ